MNGANVLRVREEFLFRVGTRPEIAAQRVFPSARFWAINNLRSEIDGLPIDNADVITIAPHRGESTELFMGAEVRFQTATMSNYSGTGNNYTFS